MKRNTKIIIGVIVVLFIIWFWYKSKSTDSFANIKPANIASFMPKPIDNEIINSLIAKSKQINRSPVSYQNENKRTIIPVRSPGSYQNENKRTAIPVRSPGSYQNENNRTVIPVRSPWLLSE
jgi:hypothetical protein